MLRSKKKFEKPTGWIIFGVLLAGFIYVTFFNTIFDEYGSVVPLIMSILLGLWTLCFGISEFIPKARPVMTKILMTTFLLIYIGVIIFNAAGEYFFWSEFGV